MIGAASRRTIAALKETARSHDIRGSDSYDAADLKRRMRNLFFVFVLLLLFAAPAFADSPYAIMPVTLAQGEAQYTGVMLFQPDTGRSWILDTSEGKAPAWIPVGFELTPGISTQNLPPRLPGTTE